MLLPMFALCALTSGPAQTSQVLGAWGSECLDLIQKRAYLPDKLLYAERISLGKQPDQIAFNWSAGVMLSALNAGAKFDPKYKKPLEQFANALHIYWNDEGPVPGYDVLPMPKPTERFYDDNAWLALGFAETAEVLGEPKFLDEAQQTLKFVLSGEDSKLGGGIYWKEQEKTHKHTCSTAPAAAACLAVFHQTKASNLLVDAIRLYTWTKRTLQDPSDHLLWDSISLNGDIEKAKWSYNTALMIRTAADLYSVTKNPQYLADLKEMQTASAKHWLSQGALHDEGRFAHLLLESWVWQRRLSPIPNKDQERSDTRALYEPLEYLHEHACNVDGFYGKRFDVGPGPEQTTFELIDQASAARDFFESALYFKDLSQKG